MPLSCEILQTTCLHAINMNIDVPGEAELQNGLVALADTLLEVDTFYSSLGGIIGYQAKCVELIQRNQQSSADAPVDDVKV